MCRTEKLYANQHRRTEEKVMNYKIVNESNTYNVFETATEQVIRSFFTVDEAKKFLRHLNLGGGFDGWSPNFFLKKINLSKKKAKNSV